MFLETICIKNDIVENVGSHRERMHNTGTRFGFRAPELPDLLSLIPAELKSCSTIKCSIVYHKHILDIRFSDYQKKTIRSLKIVNQNIDYSFKYSDRSEFNRLLQQTKGVCDEILIVKDNCITDTSFSNVVFGKNNEFFTPDTYLLNGTKRQKLLREKTIHETRIRVNDIRKFDTIYLVNAMLDLDSSVGISVKHIIK